MFDTIEKTIDGQAAEISALREQLKSRAGNPVTSGPMRDQVGFAVPASGKHDPATFEGQVELAIGKGLRRGEAIVKVAKENPQLHFEYQARLGVTRGITTLGQ